MSSNSLQTLLCHPLIGELRSWQRVRLLKGTETSAVLGALGIPQHPIIDVETSTDKANTPDYILSLLKESPSMAIFKLEALLPHLETDNDLVNSCYMAVMALVVSYSVGTSACLLPANRLMYLAVQHPAFKHSMRVVGKWLRLLENAWTGYVVSRLYNQSELISFHEATYIWLKDLRLHKYWTPVISRFSYKMLLSINEDNIDTAVDLEPSPITKGAKGRIVRSISRLRERYSRLVSISQDVQNSSNPNEAIEVLECILRTPIPNADTDEEGLTNAFVAAMRSILIRLVKKGYGYGGFIRLVDKAMELKSFSWKQKCKLLEFQQYAHDITTCKKRVWPQILGDINTWKINSEHVNIWPDEENCVHVGASFNSGNSSDFTTLEDTFYYFCMEKLSHKMVTSVLDN